MKMKKNFEQCWVWIVLIILLITFFILYSNNNSIIDKLNDGVRGNNYRINLNSISTDLSAKTNIKNSNYTINKSLPSIKIAKIKFEKLKHYEIFRELKNDVYYIPKHKVSKDDFEKITKYLIEEYGSVSYIKNDFSGDKLQYEWWSESGSFTLYVKYDDNLLNSAAIVVRYK